MPLIMPIFIIKDGAEAVDAETVFAELEKKHLG